MMMKRNPIPPVVLSLIVAIVYFAAAELGLSLASLHSNVTPVWPPTGIAIASLLIFGRRLVSRADQNLSVGLSVSAMFVVGGVEV